MPYKTFGETGAPCRAWGSIVYITARCQHRCPHCYEDFQRGAMPDMPEEIFDLYLEKSAKHGLLGNVTLIGGEPFFYRCGAFNPFYPENLAAGRAHL